jgi:hypothetical protein
MALPRSVAGRVVTTRQGPVLSSSSMCWRLSVFPGSFHNVGLAPSLRLWLPHRHGDDCESAIINKNNPAAHARATRHSHVVPARCYFLRSESSQTPPENWMPLGSTLETGLSPGAMSFLPALSTSGPKGQLFAYLGGTQQWGTRLSY